MKWPVIPWQRNLARLGWVVSGAALAAVGLYLGIMLNKPELSPWHDYDPPSEFGHRARKEIRTLDEYLALENRLFEDVREFSREVGPAAGPLSRFNPVSPTCPLGFEVNWNRTFLLDVDTPRGGVLLLHGLSDSPYSLLPLGRVLQREGYTVLGLRLPGHGTVPGGLNDVHWRDWRAAVRLAVRSLDKQIGDDAPLILAGYSNGAALALDHTLGALDDPEFRRPDRLVFLSPALAVSKLAALARWQRFLSRLPGLHKLGWNSLLLEYDPYKYNSFSINAAEQIFRLTSSLERRLQALQNSGRMGELPPVLTLQSAVDATVPPIHSLRRLYGRVESNGSEIVLFDANREAQVEMFLAPVVDQLIDALRATETSPFRATVVTNAVSQTSEVVARDRLPDATDWTVQPLGLVWPRGVYSLSHVAVPFPPDDPIYGAEPRDTEPFPLGRVEPRGERGALEVPVTLLMRLRYNPFFSYLDDRVVEFVNSAE